MFYTKVTFNNVGYLLLLLAATTATTAVKNYDLGTQFFHEDSLDCT
jgi:hypothetical protein